MIFISKLLCAPTSRKPPFVSYTQMLLVAREEGANRGRIHQRWEMAIQQSAGARCGFRIRCGRRENIESTCARLRTNIRTPYIPHEQAEFIA